MGCDVYFYKFDENGEIDDSIRFDPFMMHSSIKCKNMLTTYYDYFRFKERTGIDVFYNNPIICIDSKGFYFDDGNGGEIFIPDNEIETLEVMVDYPLLKEIDYLRVSYNFDEFFSNSLGFFFDFCEEVLNNDSIISKDMMLLEMFIKNTNVHPIVNTILEKAKQIEDFDITLISY